MERFLIDDQGRTNKRLKPLDISPTLRREMHGNEPRVVESFGWQESEKDIDIDENKQKGSDNLTNITEVFEGKPFNYVSLFSGIGGFEQALNKLGGKCVMASEIDKFANQAYEVLYGHKTVGDVTKIEAADVPDHDLLVGGFPCQAFSVAGKRLGFEDTRGTLFFEMARIAKAKQPKVILAENVKGLISHDNGKTLNTIIQALCDIGYTVDFNVLNSKYFGVPQNRERIFIVAIRDDLVEPEPWKDVEGNTVVPKGKQRIQQLEGVKTFNFDWPQQEEVTTRLRDILEDNVDEKYYLSEEKTAKLVAQLEERTEGLAIKEATTKGYAVAAEGDAVNFQFPDSKTRRGRVGKQIAQTLEASGINQGVVEPQVLRPQRTEYGKRIREEYEEGKIKESRHNMTELQPRDDGMCNTLTSVQKDNLLVEPQMLGHVDLKGHDAIKRVYSTEGVSPTLTTMGGGHREPKIAEEQIYSWEYEFRIRREEQPLGEINIVGYCKESGYKANEAVYGDNGVMSTLCARDYKDPKRILLDEIRPVLTPDRETKRQNGRRFKDDGEESFTLTAQDRHGVMVGTQPRYRIRKLTPRECFRLQSFPDSEFDKLVAAGISNSQLYKMAGNAVTVNVIDAIGRRLLPIIN